MKSIVIGTRGSQLALWQANFTKDILEKNGYQVRINIISTKGDRTQEWNLSFDKIEGKGFFTKELEECLIDGSADLAVHSCKDMPTENAPGLAIKAYSYRANPVDVLLIRKSSFDPAQFISVKLNAVIGTSSARRKSQFMSHRPDVTLLDLRGNVPTRIDKLRSGQYDAIILAAAGIERLELDISDIEVFSLAAPLYIPAPAQGVLAYQIRENDPEMDEVCKILHDEEAYKAIKLERDVLRDFHGGCQVPLGVYAQCIGDKTELWISKAVAWDAPLFRAHYQFEGELPASIDIVNQFSAIQPKKVFISREVTESDYFYSILTKAGFEVESENLLNIHGVDFQTDGQADWLFFTSRNGVKHYFNQVKYDKENCPKIGAVNAGTESSIKSLGYNVDYVGTSAYTNNTAEEFGQLASGKVILPQAVHARGVMEKSLGHCEVVSLPVYNNTILEEVESTDADILVFTSPLNAESYFKKHALKENQQVVSIGPSTQTAIESLGIHATMAYGPMPWDLVDIVMALSSK
ncbi:MAG TPA: hydroxymethylbilane synthase [Chitinophagales bacterium]|nr:hydroxymethylbilane synthase [Chitinophagales bacterium]